MIADCWRQVGPGAPHSFLPAQDSFLGCLSAQTGRSSEADHHTGSASPLPPVLSLFLSNVTLCCVTMATAGHHFEECTEKLGGWENNHHRLNCSWSQASPKVANMLLAILRKEKLRNRSMLSLLPVNGGAKCQTWQPHPTYGLRSLLSRSHWATEPFQPAWREGNKGDRGWVLGYYVDEPRNLQTTILMYETLLS